MDERSHSPKNAATTADAARPRTVRSEELFEGQRVLVIQHAGQQYRLLITRNDRLILQK